MRKNIKYLLLGLIFIMSFSLANAVDLWPLLETSKDGTTVLYPFYVNEDDFKMFFPLYYNTNKGKDTHILWPLLKFSDGRITRIVPIWFSGKEDEFVLFPLIWQTPDFTFWLIPPMYFSKTEDFTAIIPVYLRYKSPSEDTLFLFPFLRKTSDEFKQFMIFPIYSQKKGEKTDALWILPFYKENSIIKYTYNQKEIEKKKIALYPLVIIDKRKDLSDDSTKNRFTLLWPFFVREEKISKDGQLLSKYRRFLIFSDEKKEDGSRIFNVFGFLVNEKVK